jgi:dTDP-L-rhamnose 4-epimerase
MSGRVLVTGGAGFIGSHTADLLYEKGYKVRIFDNLSRFEDKKWPKYLNKNFEKIKGDVRSLKDWINALEGVDFVIHLAAMMDFHLEFSKFFEVNTLGTANLYETIVSKHFPVKKVVVASSQFVYGHGLWKCDKHAVIRPDQRFEENFKKGVWDHVCPRCGEVMKYIANKESQADPPNQYAISKYSQELISLKLGGMHDIPSTALRYSIVHGSRQSITNLYSGALRVFVLQLMQNQKLLLFEDGKTKRDFVSVNDVARANVMVMEDKRSDFEVYNVGGGRGYTIFELAKMVAMNLKKDFSAEYGSYRQGDMRHAISDISKIRKLGWMPKVSEKQSVNEFIGWVLSNNKNKPDIESVFRKMKNDGVLRKV